MKKKFTAILVSILMLSALWQPAGALAFSGTSPYTGGTYEHNDRFAGRLVVNGIDVSQWQGTIDWNKVKADGIDFAIIRAGGRSYSEGGRLYFDDNFYANIEGAQAAGIMVGVYYFSQAKTEAEAVEEAEWVIDYIEGYDVQLPVYMDYEHASDSANPGRIKNLTKAQRTANAKAFCETIEAAGYETGVYSNLNFLNDSIDGAALSKLYTIWAAQYNYRCQYASEYLTWQYSSSGSVEGISGRTDMNFTYLEEKPAASQTLSLANCQIEVADVVYDGAANYEPEVKVTYNGTVLTEGRDYKVGYIGNRDLGEAYVYVVGAGQYADYQVVSFEVREYAAVDESMVTSQTYDIGDYVTGVSLETSAESFAANLAAAEGFTFKLLNEDNAEITSGLIGTGNRLIAYDEEGEICGSSIVVIRGDSDGDGKCSIFDLIDMRSHLAVLRPLSGAYEKALDIDLGGEVDIFDLIDLRMHLAGLRLFE